MTSKLHCRIYYSLTGDTFKICDRYTDEKVARANIFLHIEEPEPEPVLEASFHPGYSYQERPDGIRLTVDHEIPAGDFFSSDTHCIIVNGKNQIMRVGDKYRLPINLYRSFEDPSKLRLFFTERTMETKPTWICF